MKLSKFGTPAAEWYEAYERSVEIVGKDNVERLIDKAVARIKEHAPSTHATFGWSGGKDSQALRVICDRAGIKDAIMSEYGVALEFPEIRKWRYDSMPDFTNVFNHDLQYDFLNKHPELLFPKDKKQAGRWYHPQRAAWNKYVAAHKFDAIILGHRTQDGNYCGKPGDGGVYFNGDTKKVCPMYDYTHMEMLAIMKYGGFGFAPTYNWPFKDSFGLGVRGWPERPQNPGDSEDKPMDEVAQIDVQCLVNAAPHIKRIADYLDRKGIQY
ncbi:MAG: hypothetical protein PHS57_05835 [Alphaproteobacteria bacterium]|nr:hypothetical protein [Alphaproteobacteria bacterium]